MAYDPVDLIDGLATAADVSKAETIAELKAVVRAFADANAVRAVDLSGRTRIMVGEYFYRKDTESVASDDGVNVIIDFAGNHWLLSAGIGLANIVEDTTPQLGGALDSNGKQIRWSKGADVASPGGGAITLGDDGNYFDITGTNAITSIVTKAVGTVVKLQFDAALTLTHHATDLILPGAANITTAAGDEAEFVEYATGGWRCTNYSPASGVQSKATDANVRAAASNKALTSDLIESASAIVTLTDAATIAVDWDTGINFDVTLTTDRALGNPTNGQPGTWRTVLVKSDGGPDTLTFGNQYGGELPTIADVTTTQFHLLAIYCKTATQFLVMSIDGSDA